MAITTIETTNGVRSVDPPLRIVERAARAAELADVPENSIERLPFDLSALDQDGILVNVDARNFGLLDRRLDWRVLGVTLPRRELSFGRPRCMLIPDRYRLPLQRPPARAHAALHRYSYHFRLVETVFESVQYRWVPWTAWQAFERAFAAEQVQLAAALDSYDAGFASVRERVLKSVSELATDSARRLAATGEIIPRDFEDGVVAELISSLPTPDLLRSQLSLKYRVGVMQLGSEMWAEARAAAEERRPLQEAESEVRLIRQRTEAAERLIQEQLWTEQQRVRRQLQVEEDERQREAEVKERLRRLKLEAARERLDETLSPLVEGARQLRAKVYEAASTLRASIQKNQSLRGPSARKLRELCRWYGMMNWRGDAQLEALISDLEELGRVQPPGAASGVPSQ
jgi:hypothetical protein